MTRIALHSDFCVGVAWRAVAAAFLTCALAVLAAAASLSASAQPAYASAFALGEDAYACSRVDISAQVETDATLHVVDQRTFSFDGVAQRVVWPLDGFAEDGARIEVRGVRMAQVDAEGNVTGEWTDLPATSFSLDWREGGGAEKLAYAYDSPKDTLYVFFVGSVFDVIVEVDYVVTGGMVAYADMVDLSWEYVPAEREAAFGNVTLDVALPVPAGVTVLPGENVCAWGHGPESGSVEVRADGTVAYSAALVGAGQYELAHVLFPAEWLTNADRSFLLAHQGNLILEETKAAEAAWTDSSSAWWCNRLRLFAALAFGCAGLLLAALALYALFGRDFKPDYRGAFWCGVPEEGMQPAVLGRLMRWNRRSARDIGVTVSALAQVGAVRVGEGGSLTVVDRVACRRADALERATLNLLFWRIAGGQATLSVAEVGEFAARHPQELLRLVREWQQVLTAEVVSAELFDARSLRLQKVLAVLACALAVSGVAMSAVMGDVAPAGAMLPTGIALGVLANYMPRRTKRGNGIAARCKALQNWLRDCRKHGEARGGNCSASLPEDPRARAELLTLAYVLDVAADGATGFASDSALDDAVASEVAASFADAVEAAEQAVSIR